MMNSPSMIVLFDIDGTLLSSSGAGLRALERAMADLHGITESMRGISLAGRTDRSIVRDLVKAHGLPAGPATEDAILESYLGHLPEQLTAAAKLLPGIKPLLEHLYRHAVRPEFTCRFRWRKNSIAFWDNRATWHYAANDYHGARRLMHRITVSGCALEAA